VIFVDSNLFIYAVGRPHPLRDEARVFFAAAGREGMPLATSAEVLQELLHVYLPVQRVATLDAALELASRSVDRVLPVEAADVAQARTLLDEHPALAARDLLHLAVCRRHGITDIKTFDRGLQAAFKRRRRG
jgi:predicted nucleic acid-binding protein